MANGNTTKFDGMATDYSKYRPGYPGQVVDFLIENVGISESSCIADIGSGTGKFSKILLERGFKVFGVEPNQDMRRKAEEELQHVKNFTSVDGTSEATTLSDYSIDLITVAQAFHWFDIELFINECNRILKENGYVAILYNQGDYSTEIINLINKLSKKYCPKYVGSSGGLGNNSTVFNDIFTKYTTEIFENNYELDKRQFLGLNFSASYAPKPSDPTYEEYYGNLELLFEKYSQNGILTMPNNTIVRLGKVRKRVLDETAMN